MLTVDSFLSAGTPGGGSGAPGSNGAFGYTTLLVKWNFLKNSQGDIGVALVPFARFPLARTGGETSRPESGLITPFHVDLDGGWELEGSTEVIRDPAGVSHWNTQWENQAGVERTLTVALTVYLGLELDSGDGPPVWTTEFGVTYQLNPRILIDIGGSAGTGRHSPGRMSYAGIGWSF